MQYKNFELHIIIDFLSGMTLSGRASLGRSAFKKALVDKQNEYSEEQIEVVDEFEAWIDRDKGQFDDSNPELKQSNLDLGNKHVDITVDSPFLDDFITALESYDESLTGTDADVYAKLYGDLVKGGEE